MKTELSFSGSSSEAAVAVDHAVIWATQHAVEEAEGGVRPVEREIVEVIWSAVRSVKETQFAGREVV